MKRQYNKLVRDNIPKIIRQSGSKCKVRKVSGNTKLKYLIAKVREELKEFEDDYSIDELADLGSVFNGIMDHMNFKLKDVNNIMEQKDDRNGTFDKGYVLVYVEDGD